MARISAYNATADWERHKEPVIFGVSLGITDLPLRIRSAPVLDVAVDITSIQHSHAKHRFLSPTLMLV